MQTLNNHIKSGAYSDFYLLYGEEDYLIRYYRDRLSEGILNDSPSGNMNYRYYNSGHQLTIMILQSRQSLYHSLLTISLS